jgi:hypothetical protein
MPSVKGTFRIAWAQAREAMQEECGTDKNKLMTMEVFGLRELALQLKTLQEKAVAAKDSRPRPDISFLNLNS